MSKEAMKLALEALRLIDDAMPFPVAKHAMSQLRQAIEQAEQPAQTDIPDLIAGALGVSRGTAYDLMREALAEQAEQAQPVAMYEDWYDSNSCGHCGMVGGHATSCRHYTAPPPRQPLTDEEKENVRLHRQNTVLLREKLKAEAEAKEWFYKYQQAAHGITKEKA